MSTEIKGDVAATVIMVVNAVNEAKKTAGGPTLDESMKRLTGVVANSPQALETLRRVCESEELPTDPLKLGAQTVKALRLKAAKYREQAREVLGIAGDDSIKALLATAEIEERVAQELVDLIVKRQRAIRLAVAGN